MRIGIVANTCWYLYNFRRNLIDALQSSGHDVVALAGGDDYADKLAAAGVECVRLPAMGGDIAIAGALRCVAALRRALRNWQPDIVLTYTPKGTIYTSLALGGSSTPTIANISGLGRAFVRDGALARLVLRLYRHALQRAVRVFFQNADDEAMFIRRGLIDRARSVRIPGSGVDLDRFAAAPPPALDAASASSPVPSTSFLMVARLIREKGVEEFAEAARIVRQQVADARFTLLGPFDAHSASRIEPDQVRRWVEEGSIAHAGMTDDVRPFIAAADCVVLPSFYREGVPRTLLEAAAMARPLITTDMPGCRDAVEDGVNGYLCPPRDARALADAMLRFAALPTHERRAMGQRSRDKAVREFDERIVIDRYLDAVSRVRLQ